MKRLTITAVILGAVFIPLIALAADVSRALYTLDIRIVPTSSAAFAAVPFPLPTGSLIASDFIQDDAYNAVIHEGGADRPGMPGSSRLVMVGALAEDGGILTDQTAAADNATANDITLLPTAPVVDDAYYFIGGTPWRILNLQTGQQGVGTWTVQWEYTTGTASTTFTVLTNVTDNTSGFTSAVGTSTVTWDMPSDWSTTTVGGIEGYAVRARVTAVTATTTQPLGTRATWETGQWWTLVEDVSASQNVLYKWYGGGPDMVSAHRLFLGNAGITTTDAAGVELADHIWDIEIVGYFDTDNTTGTAAEAWILEKTSAIRIYVSDNNEITAQVNEGPTATITGVASGEHTLLFVHTSSGAELAFSIDGANTTTVADATVVDNGNQWNIGQNGTTVYLDSLRIRRRTGEAETQVWQPLETTTNPAALDYTTSSRDSYTDQGAPDANHGTSTVISIDANTINRGWIWFDVLGHVTSNITVDSAVMRLWVNVFADSPLRVYGADSDWAELSITHNNQPAVSTTYCDLMVGTSTLGYWTANMTSCVQAIVNGTLTNYGWRIHADTAVAGTTAILSSGAGAPPSLSITTTDEPSTSTVLADTESVLLYQLTSTPGLLVLDQSTNDNDGYMSWPAQPTNYAITAGTLLSTRQPEALLLGGLSADIAGGISALPNLAVGSADNPGLPGSALVLAIFDSEAGPNIPARFFWVSMALVTTFIAIAATAVALKSIMMPLILGGLLLLFWSQIGDGVVPLWSLFVYSPIALLATMFRPRIAA